jgi:hypothetical protein
MKTIFAFLLAALFASQSFAADGEFKPPANKQKFMIFLLVGQSNMAGRGKVEAQDQKAHPRVWKLDKDGKWAPAVDPLHWDKPNVAGVGLGTTFGKTIAEQYPDAVIGLVPAAFGGTSIDQWAPDKDKGLYADAIHRAKAALKDGTLAGILWHQGEADEKKADVYAEKAKKLFESFRKDLGSPTVPVVVGAVGEFHAGSEEINKVLASLPQTIPHCAFVSSKGLTDKGDKTHFNSESYREFGKRYAAAWNKLSAAEKK